MTGLETVLGGLVTAAVTGTAGYIIGGKGKVSDAQCDKNQTACTRLICAELGHIKEELISIKGEITALRNLVK